MTLIPFIYFTGITIYWWRKHQGLDICVYMSSLYAFISLCSAIIEFGNLIGDGEGGILFDEYDVHLTLVPTLIYCVLLTLSLLPFSLLYRKDIKAIVPKAPLTLYFLSWFLIGISFLNLYLVADSTLDILGGDLAAVREAHYNGIMTPAQLKAESMPFILRALYYFNISTLLALPIFFYYTCFEKRPWWFKALLLFASISAPLAAIQTVDRTEIIYYALMFIYCLVFFWKHLSHKFKRRLSFFGLPFAGLALVYLIAVTQARFSEDEGKSGAGVMALQYAGQQQFNFCYFWDNADFSNIAPEREFPLIWHYAFNIDTDDIRRGDRSGEHGFFISVFATFIGDIMLDISPIGAAIWVLFYFLINFLIIGKAHREELSEGEMIILFTMAVIPIFGIFYYRYFHYLYTFMIILAVFVYIMSKIKTAAK